MTYPRQIIWMVACLVLIGDKKSPYIPVVFGALAVMLLIDWAVSKFKP